MYTMKCLYVLSFFFSFFFLVKTQVRIIGCAKHWPMTSCGSEYSEGCKGVRLLLPNQINNTPWRRKQRLKRVKIKPWKKPFPEECFLGVFTSTGAKDNHAELQSLGEKCGSIVRAPRMEKSSTALLTVWVADATNIFLPIRVGGKKKMVYFKKKCSHKHPIFPSQCV